MPQKMIMGVAAAVAFGSLAQVAGAGERLSGGAEVYPPIHAMTYAVGSNGFSGFFQQTDGKCALTMMLFKLANPDEATPDKSPARVQVSVRPGEQVRIGSAEGEAIQLSCDADAGTVSVSHSQNRSEPVTADLR